MPLPKSYTPHMVVAAAVAAAAEAAATKRTAADVATKRMDAVAAIHANVTVNKNSKISPGVVAHAINDLTCSPSGAGYVLFDIPRVSRTRG